jgi:apolipoprotein N-acyltransferase
MAPYRRAGDALACAAGGTLTLAFAPFGFFPLAVLAPAALFLLWDGCSPARAAWRGLLFGIGLFGSGVTWVYVSMYNFGNMAAPLAAVAAFLFAAVLALFPMACGWLQARFFDVAARRHRLLVLPALWVLTEWLRSWVLTGFPWLSLGYSQTDSPLAGYLPWTGMFGVSLMCALSAGLLAQMRHDARVAIRAYIPAMIALWVGGWVAGLVQWTRPVDGPVSVALVQGNVPLTIKWQPRYRDEIAGRYLQLTRAAPPARLVVWPEAAIPAFLDQSGAVMQEVATLARERSSDFLIGVVEREPGARSYYNSVATVGAHAGIYRKQHLVPFGEFLPFKPLFGWLIQFLQIPMSDFSAGAPGQAPLAAAGQVVGVSVCYEDAFGDEVIRALPAATLLVNVSEDAWFGDSLAPHQRLQMARVRALETGRPMLRAANTGPSAIIDARGEVVALSPQFQPWALTGTVQPMTGMTPYARAGDWPVVLMAILMLTLAAVIRRQR